MLKRVQKIAFIFLFLAAFNSFSQSETNADTVPQMTKAEEVKPKKDIKKDESPIAFIDDIFGQINKVVGVIFEKIPVTPELDKHGNPKKDAEGNVIYDGIPFILAILAIGGLFFTLRFMFINVRLFKHGVDVVRGKYDNPEDEGQISHFQALTSALSATVGLGNIAGVAIAIAVGGPGAVFWMWLVAFFGMSMKFASCTLAQCYRRIDEKGEVLGGPMIYLDEGLKEKGPGWAKLGKVFAILFAGFTIMASFGGGNLFQGKMSYEISAAVIPSLSDQVICYAFGIIIAIVVGFVILGGITRIGSVTSKAVPFMCVFYCLVCLVTVIVNISDVPGLILQIFKQAFAPEAAFGGFFGVLIQGMKRAAFSNEAGFGSAAIAHAAAKTDEPVREGTVAMMGPFIDTIVVCTLTALAILITGVHVGVEPGNWVEGAVLTADAFGKINIWCKYLLVPAVLIFAISTMISWSYYGERSMVYLFGRKMLMPYRICFTIFVALGPILTVKNALDFSDTMLFAMVFPNIIGMIILSGKLNRMAKEYKTRLDKG